MIGSTARVLNNLAHFSHHLLVRDERIVRHQRGFDLGAEPQVVSGGVFLGVEFGYDRIELFRGNNLAE